MTEITPMTDINGFTPIAKSGTKRPRKMAREPKAKTGLQHAPKRETKTDLVLALLSRAEGAKLHELVAATGWLPHTTRAVLTGLRKKGHVLVSEKFDGVRRYRIGGGVA